MLVDAVDAVDAVVASNKYNAAIEKNSLFLIKSSEALDK